MGVLPSITIMILIHLAQGYPYSSSGERRYNRASYNPAYVPLPVSYGLNQQGFETQPQQQRAFQPYYYYPYRSERTYDDVPVSDVTDDGDYQSGYPYGQELWYEGGADAAANAAAAATREAILQNLIIAQMYEDAAANAAVNGFPLYQPPADEYGKKYQYGVPTTDIDEKERARQYLIKNEADEEVKELESLPKPKETNKDGKRRRKQKNKERKNSAARENNAREVEVFKRGEVLTTSSPVLLTEQVLKNSAHQLSSNTISGGQKEFAIPQPARVRRPLDQLQQRLHTRSEDPSVYQTIKKLLELESNEKTEGSRLQKRFVSSEQQLTQQLNNLKRSAM